MNNILKKQVVIVLFGVLSIMGGLLFVLQEASAGEASVLTSVRVCEKVCYAQGEGYCCQWGWDAANVWMDVNNMGLHYQ